MQVDCLFCKQKFEVPEESKLRICKKCLTPDSINARIDRLQQYDKPPFILHTQGR